MAVPKKKTSKSRRDMRRSHHALKPVSSVECPNCGEFKLPHAVCPECGEYKGKEIIHKPIETDDASSDSEE